VSGSSVTSRLRTLTGVEKAAIVVMQLEPDSAVEIMRRLSEDEAEKVAAEIVRLRSVDSELAEAVLGEFRERSVKGIRLARGGLEVAQTLLAGTFGSERAASFAERLALGNGGASFDFLESADPASIAALLDGELPEVSAVVLAQLDPGLASGVMARLRSDYRTDVAQCIATMGAATPESVANIAEVLRKRVRSIVMPNEMLEAAGGIQPLVEIVNRSDVSVERDLLESLAERDPELAEEVRSRLITFADLVRLEDQDVQLVLRGIDLQVLAVAMKGADEELVEVIRRNMTERNRDRLEEERGYIGAVRVSQIDAARSEVVRAIRELEAEGTISVHRANEDVFVD